MRRTLLCGLVLVLMTACAAEPTPTPVPPTAVPTQPPTATATALPSPTATNLPSPTSTLTATPSLTATLPPTETSTPTLAATEEISPTNGTAPPVAVGTGDPVHGKELFSFYLCESCHSVTQPFPGGEFGPNLGNISVEAVRVIALPEYKGTATDAESYIRESILNPNAFIVPGANYTDAPGVSVMTQDFGASLPPQDVQDLIAYLLSLDAQ